MIDLKLELFGAFRSWLPDGEIELKVAPGSRVRDLRSVLAEALRSRSSSNDPRGLIESSVFADDRSVLDENSPVERGMRLAVLPPVCGG